MKHLFTLLMMVLSFSLAAQDKTINDPNAQVRNVAGFSAIKISGGIDLYLSQGAEAVAVSAADIKWRDRIRTEVADGVLKIWFEGDKSSWMSGNKHLKAYVSYKSLNKLQASGACDIKMNGTMDLASFSMELTGASQFKGVLKINDLKLILHGASDLKVSGYIGTLKAEASGASDLRGYDLIVDQCTLNASGASNLNLTVNKELRASASGASSISYKGDAVVKDLHSSGASSINKKG